MIRCRVLVVLGMGLATAAPACREPAPAGAAATEGLRLRVRVIQPKREDLVVASALIGTLRPNRHAVLSSRAAGDVASLGVERGDRVTKGQLLGGIRVPGAGEHIAVAAAGQEVARAALSGDEEQAARARRVAEANAGAIAPQEVAILQAKADQAAARLESARAEAARARAFAADARIVAPFAGVVLVRHVDPGTSVAAGARLVEIADVDTLRLVLDVPERMAALVKPGAKVVVSVPALRAARIDAGVSRYAPALDPATRLLRVEIDLPNDGTLVAGAEARVRFAESGKKAVLTLPADALVLRGERPFVFVAKDGAAVRVPIEIGFDDGAVFEIRSGLEGSEEVVLGGGSLLDDGVLLEVAR